MIKSKLAHAIALAVSGMAISSAASASTTMYNTYNAGANPGWNAGDVSAPSSVPTDGWTHTNGSTNSGALQSWVGTSGGSDPRPFGYTGSAALNWAIQLNSATDAGTISSADALSRYNVAADIDTGKGAWVDAASTPTGWRHAIDFGLIQSSVDTDIRLSATALQNNVGFASNFGISIYDGMDGSTSWGHHGPWHNGYVIGDQSAANLAKVNGNNPIGMTGLTFQAFTDGSNLTSNANNQDYIVFHALAGHTYTVILGGSDGGQTWSGNQASYALNVQAVPVPGAVWLFGSALVGMVGFGRRKASVAA